LTLAVSAAAARAGWNVLIEGGREVVLATAAIVAGAVALVLA